MEYEKTYRNPPNPYQPIILLLEMGLLVNSVFIIITPRFADFNAELRNGFNLQIVKNSRIFLKIRPKALHSSATATNNAVYFGNASSARQFHTRVFTWKTVFWTWN